MASKLSFDPFWGPFGVSLALFLARLGMLWTHGYEWVGSWLAGFSVLFFLWAVIMLVWPFVFPPKKKEIISGNTIGTIQGNSGIVTQGQTGGTNTVTVNQEDKSPKRKLRDLFNLIDPKIVPKVAAGERQLTVRMQPFDIDQLNALVNEAGTPTIVAVTGFGRHIKKSLIANGTLGPSFAVEDQTEVHISFNVGSLD